MRNSSCYAKAWCQARRQLETPSRSRRVPVEPDTARTAHCECCVTTVWAGNPDALIALNADLEQKCGPGNATYKRLLPRRSRTRVQDRWLRSHSPEAKHVRQDRFIQAGSMPSLANPRASPRCRCWPTVSVCPTCLELSPQVDEFCRSRVESQSPICSSARQHRP